VTWLITFPLLGVLIKGGIFGLSSVEIDKWGGLPLTLMLATNRILLSYPLSVIFALCRQSKLPVIQLELDIPFLLKLLFLPLHTVNVMKDERFYSMFLIDTFQIHL
jgi:general L-amino acid transport system permease protein